MRGNMFLAYLREELSSISARPSKTRSSSIEDRRYCQPLQLPAVMYFFSVIIPPLAASTQAAINGHCIDDGSGGAGYSGICETIATCNYYGGTHKNDLCPNDPSDGKFPPSSHIFLGIIFGCSQIRLVSKSIHLITYNKSAHSILSRSNANSGIFHSQVLFRRKLQSPGWVH